MSERDKSVAADQCREAAEAFLGRAEDIAEYAGKAAYASMAQAAATLALAYTMSGIVAVADANAV